MKGEKEILVSFLVGGTITALITYLVKYVKPEYGSMIIASPKIFIPTIILLVIIGGPYKKTEEYIFNCLPYMIILTIWLFLFITLIKILKINDNNAKFIITIVIAIILYISLSCGYYKVKNNIINKK
tara:strand:- start:551 stop:931 length:381 start_codon:yes stop_codon:yes gene_type:complete